MLIIRQMFCYINPSPAMEINHFKVLSTKDVCIKLLISWIYFSIQANSVDPDQTAPTGAV